MSAVDRISVRVGVYTMLVGVVVNALVWPNVGGRKEWGAIGLLGLAIGAVATLATRIVTLRANTRFANSLASFVNANTPGKERRVAFDDDDTGAISRAVTEVFDRWRAEALRVSSAHVADGCMLAALTEGAVGIDSRGIVIAANAPVERIAGVTPLVGRDIYEIFRQSATHDLLRDLLTHARPGEIEIPIGETGAEGSARVYRINAAPVQDPSAPIRGVLVFTDITAYVRTQRMRRDFFDSASHELQTPLTSIIGYLEILEESASDPELFARSVSAIARQAQRMRTIVLDLLLLSRLESAQWAVKRERYDIVAQTRQIIETLRPEAASRSQTITVDCAGSELYVLADAEKIGIALTNLVDNAVKYAGEKARIRILLHALDGALRIKVADTGVGIARENLDRIFERFYRVESSRSRDQGGSGLGLSIVRYILAAHGERIEVSSGPGEGTSFTFTLPVAQPHD